MVVANRLQLLTCVTKNFILDVWWILDTPL